MAKEIVKDVIGNIPRAEFDNQWSLLDQGNGPYFAFADRVFAEHKAVLASEVLKPGFILSYPVCDGKAHYRVESLKPLKVQHIPLGDGYRIREAEIRGLSLEDVQDAFEREVRFEKLWNRHRAS